MPGAERSSRAARRATDASGWEPLPVPSGVAVDALTAAYTATRRLARADQPVQAVEAVCELVHELGATVVAAWLAPDEALPIDVGLGVVPPRLPLVPPLTLAEMHLKTLLPGVVDDARAVVQRLRRSAGSAGQDPEQAVLSRQSLLQSITGLPEGTAALLLRVEPAALTGQVDPRSELVQFVRATTRATDVVGRVNDDVVTVVLPGTPLVVAARRAAQLHDLWSDVRRDTTLRSRVIVLGGADPGQVLHDAERSLTSTGHGGPGRDAVWT